MRRFFVPPVVLSETVVPLEGEVLHHLAVVLRLAVGDEIVLLDGHGTLCRCQITLLQKKSGQATVVERWQEPDTAFPIHLMQALPKGDKMDLILQKARNSASAASRHCLAIAASRNWPRKGRTALSTLAAHRRRSGSPEPPAAVAGSGNTATAD
ncbi:MAG: RsmE family RNA methyltransferase [Syntrophotaleaceae bacterium]